MLYNSIFRDYLKIFRDFAYKGNDDANNNQDPPPPPPKNLTVWKLWVLVYNGGDSLNKCF